MQRKLNESFIDQYSQRFSNKIVGQHFEDHESISGKEILSITPSKQVNFLILKSLFAKWQAEMKGLESPYFNFKDQEVRKALVIFMNVVSQKIEMDEAHFSDLLQEATADTLMLIAEPWTYLQKDMHDRGNQPVSVKVTKGFLKYLKVYKGNFEELFEQQNGNLVEELLEKAHYFFVTSEWSEQMQEALAQMSQIEPVEYQDLIVIESGADHEGEEVSLDDYDDDVFDSGNEQSFFDDDHDEPFAEQEHELIHDEEPAAIEPDPEPEVRPQGTSSPSLFEEEKIEESTQEPKKTLNDTYEKQERETLAEKMMKQAQQSKIESFMEAISVNNRYMFVNDLFGGDKVMFEQAMNELSSCESFDQAVEKIVQGYAKELQWDMNSPEVKELLKVIFRKFR